MTKKQFVGLVLGLFFVGCLFWALSYTAVQFREEAPLDRNMPNYEQSFQIAQVPLIGIDL